MASMGMAVECRRSRDGFTFRAVFPPRTLNRPAGSRHFTGTVPSDPPQQRAPADFAADDRFLRALTRKLANDAHLGDDAAQETWLRALQHAQAPSLFADFGRSWLAVVAKNAVLQALRGRDRRVRREQATARERADRDVVEGLAADERARLLAAVRALPDDYRTVIQMRFFDDLMPVAIADALGLPIETVRTRLKRALERLRGVLPVR